MHNIYDADRFIDKCFLKGLVEDYKQYYYGDCKVNFQYKEYQNDLVTIERLDIRLVISRATVFYAA